MRFEPEGITQNPEIPFAKSMPDYIMRWLASRFLDVDTQEELGILTKEVRARKAAEDAATSATSDTAGPSNGTATAAPTRRRGRRPGGPGSSAGIPTVAGSQPGDARGRRRPDRRAAGAPGPDDGAGPRPRLQPVRRDDAADRVVLHVQQLRQQHRLRLTAAPDTR